VVRLRNDFARWLAPTGIFATAFGMALYALNPVGHAQDVPAARDGRRAVARSRGIVITANHVSDLDGLVIAAALPWSRFRRLFGREMSCDVLQPAF